MINLDGLVSHTILYRSKSDGGERRGDGYGIVVGGYLADGHLHLLVKPKNNEAPIDDLDFESDLIYLDPVEKL